MTKKVNPLNTVFFIGTPLIAVLGGGYYGWSHGITWVAVMLFFGMLTLTLMSISAGYHRLFAHRTHEAAPWLKVCYLIFGAAAFQHSCLRWATEHRLHHRFVDTDADPYNIKAGPFWAHIGWILYDDFQERPAPKDLLEDPLVMWQARYWVPLGILFCFGFPMAIGAYFGDAWGGLLFGGFVRLVVAHHLTFMINSLAHMIGSQPYTDENTGRDSWITAIFTFGEGYHNFHHWNPGDYRNGIRFYHWDPPKWFIRTMSWFGQTWACKRAPEEAILRARIKMEHQRVRSRHGSFGEKFDELFENLMHEIDRLSKRRQAWIEGMRSSSADRIETEVAKLRETYIETKRQYRQSYRAWRGLVRQAGASSGVVSQ